METFLWKHLFPFAGYTSYFPPDEEERRPGWPENGSGEGQRPSAGPRQRVGQQAERRILCSQTQGGDSFFIYLRIFCGRSFKKGTEDW